MSHILRLNHCEGVLSRFKESGSEWKGNRTSAMGLNGGLRVFLFGLFPKQTVLW